MKKEKKVERLPEGVRNRNGKYSYYFRYKDETGKWKTKEKSGFSSPKEAKTALIVALAEFNADGFVQAAVKETFQVLGEYWFEHIAESKLRYNSISLYNNLCKNHIYPAFGDKTIDKISTDQLQRFFTQKQKELSPPTLGLLKVIFNHVFSLAVKRKMIKHNPIKDVYVSLKKRKTNKKAVLDMATLKQIESMVVGTRFHAPFLISLHTGLRRGEVLGLTWGDIDFKGQRIFVNKQIIFKSDDGLVQQEPKTATSHRSLGITDFLVSFLKEHKKRQTALKAAFGEEYFAGDDFVCCTDDGFPLFPISVTQYFINLSRRIGIPFSFHDFRHAHATLMLEADGSIKVIQERLGHSTISTTLDVYSHVTKKLEDTSLQRFENLFANQ